MQLEEADISRILKHFNEDEVCFISAYRGENSREQNKELTWELGTDLKKLGYGAIRITGGYPEPDNETGEIRDTIEQSFIVINPKTLKNPNFAEEMFALCKKYKQHSILLKDNEHEPGWYDVNGKMIGKPKNKFTTSDIQNGFSKIHGHAFSFTEADFEYEDFNRKKRGFGFAVEGIILRRNLNLKNIY